MKLLTNIEKSELIRAIPKRIETANKGTYGKTLIIAGSEGMCGAAFLSGLAAYRSGAGLVKLLTVDSNRSILQSLLPEAIIETYAEGMDLNELISRNLFWADFIVMGPGMGTTELSIRVVKYVLGKLSLISGQALKLRPRGLRLLVDADGLNILSIDPEAMRVFDVTADKIPVIITPHPMEMSRLSGREPAEIIEHAEACALEFSEAHHVMVLLKGSNTVVTDAALSLKFINHQASPALSKGGSGDVLSGCIAGIAEILHSPEHPGAAGAAAPENRGAADFARRKELLYAGSIGSLVLSAAGEKASLRYGEHGVLARNTADELGKILDELRLSIENT